MPSGGTLASVSTSGAIATLTLNEGAGAPDTSVGSFTVALAASATGIHDAAGNQSSFAATAPTDGAKPVLVTLSMLDNNTNGKVDRVTRHLLGNAGRLHARAPLPGRSPTCPSGGLACGLAVAATAATLTITEGAGAANTAVGSFTVALATSATGIRDAGGQPLQPSPPPSPTDGAAAGARRGRS